MTQSSTHRDMLKDGLTLEQLPPPGLVLEVVGGRFGLVAVHEKWLVHRPMNGHSRFPEKDDSVIPVTVRDEEVHDG